MLRGYFNEVSRVFQGSFKGVLRMFQGYLKEVSRMFQESFEGVSRKFKGCFKEKSRREFQKNFHVVSVMSLSREIKG